jgi:hypothetical protein
MDMGRRMAIEDAAIFGITYTTWGPAAAGSSYSREV